MQASLALKIVVLSVCGEAETFLLIPFWNNRHILVEN